MLSYSNVLVIGAAGVVNSASGANIDIESRYGTDLGKPRTVNGNRSQQPVADK